MRICGALIGLILAASACAPTPKTGFAAAPAGEFTLDPTHASVIFRVGHLNGLSRYVARFDDFDAALDFDPDNPEASQVEATIVAASINTGLPDFDAQIANSGSLLDAEAHPEIRFVSTEIEITGENTAIVTGDLTLRGQTAPAVLDVVFNGAVRDPLRGNRRALGFSATTKITRSDWGADAYVNFGVADAVEVLIEAEFLGVG